MLRRTYLLLLTVLFVACGPTSKDDASSDPIAVPGQGGGPNNGSTSTTPTSPAPDGPTGSQGSPLKLTRTLGIVLYKNFEALDVFGPAEMFSYVGPQLKTVYVAEKAGPVMSKQGVAAVADFGFDNAPYLDILMVPGGFGTVPELINPSMLDFLKTRAKEAELVTSVCTGSAILGRAGVLDGYKATSNKLFFNLARASSTNVTWIEKARWVEDRNRITSSGVSAGMDMSLAVIQRLYGEKVATTIAYSTEYTWHRDPNDDPFYKP